MTAVHLMAISGILMLLGVAFVSVYILRKRLKTNSFNESFEQRTPEEVHEEFRREIAENEEKANRGG